MTCFGLKPLSECVCFTRAFGSLLVALVLALGVFLVVLGRLGIVLVVGFYLYWRKERRRNLFCPSCGRHYAPEEGPLWRVDHTELKSLG